MVEVTVIPGIESIVHSLVGSIVDMLLVMPNKLMIDLAPILAPGCKVCTFSLLRSHVARGRRVTN